MFSVMWSEHCSYKSSKPLLRTLPTAGEGVVAGPGENAGVISIGDGLAVAFKIESHNHPSAVEPYQGAATGVGGILRDIFTMGARPIAVLDALRFGDPARCPDAAPGRRRRPRGRRLRQLRRRADGRRRARLRPELRGNPLVNVMAIGLLEERLLTLAAAPGPGNLVVLFGSATGRDGIGGASVLASATFTDDDPSKRPSVQVGDPFAEKLLIEASLELIERGLVEGLQDLGAGGITCATSETADRAGTGIVGRPRRDPSPRAGAGALRGHDLRVAGADAARPSCPTRWDAVREVCERWGLPVAIIGRVTGDGDIAIVEGGLDADGRPAAGAHEIARIPAAALTSDAIVHARVASAPARPSRRPRPGAPAMRQRPAARAGHGPGRRPARPPRLGQPGVAPRRLPASTTRRSGGHRRRPGPRRRGPARQGHDEGARRDDGRQPVGRRARSVAGRGAVSVAEATRNVSITGRPAAGRHELPQLRRPDPARGVLAAERGRARPGATRAARWACRSPAATSPSTTSRRPARSPRRPRSASSACSTTSRRSSARRSSQARRRDPARRRGDARPGRLRIRGAGRRRDGGRPADARPRPRGGAPGVRPRGDRSRARRLGAGRLGRRPGGRARRVRDVGRARGASVRVAVAALAGGRPVRREPIAPRRHLPAALCARR